MANEESGAVERYRHAATDNSSQREREQIEVASRLSNSLSS